MHNTCIYKIAVLVFTSVLIHLYNYKSAFFSRPATDRPSHIGSLHNSIYTEVTLQSTPAKLREWNHIVDQVSSRKWQEIVSYSCRTVNFRITWISSSVHGNLNDEFWIQAVLSGKRKLHTYLQIEMYVCLRINIRDIYDYPGRGCQACDPTLVAPAMPFLS